MSGGTDFRYGDLIIKCHQCGNIKVVEEMVTDGRAIYLFNKKDSWLRLTCPECNITMEMCLVPNENANAEIEDVIVASPEIELIETDEKLSQASPTKETV